MATTATYFAALRETHGQPTSVMTTQTSTLADQKEALYRLSHSCGKYMNNQATHQEKDKPISYLYIYIYREREREREQIHLQKHIHNPQGLEPAIHQIASQDHNSTFISTADFS
jgi:hypothetical protein